MSELETIPEAPEVEPVENTEIAEAVDEAEEIQEESAAPEEAEESPKPKRSRAADRINALTREKYEAQKQAEAYQAQVAELQRYVQQANQPDLTADMPKIADYDYDENRYQQAVAQWQSEKMQSLEMQRQQQDRQRVMQAEEQRQQAILGEKVAEGMAKYPDFQQKVFDPSLPPLRQINPSAYQAVLESDKAADVAYYLASNPQEVYQFASMNPVQAIRAVALLESRIGKKLAAHKAPQAPPSRVQGNSESMKNPSDMTTEEFMRWREASTAKR